jgi:hypothetical protein
VLLARYLSAMAEQMAACCDELRSAVQAAFAIPITGQAGWILYGTDHDSVLAGEPELRYWPIRYCPFCGAALPPPTETAAT